MIRRLHPPRLLPITIFALSGLLAVKSAELVSAAVTATEAQPKAAATETPAPPPQPTPSGNPAQSDAAKPSDDGTAPIVADGERTVLLELRQRRLELDAREATLAARESLLAAAEQKVATRVTELQVLQKKLEALEATRQQREDVSWLGLVKVYESMKPRDAATIFNDLEMPVLLQVIDRMKEAKAAPVLAAMQPDKARDLTARLAQMRTHRDDPGGGTVGG